MTNHKANFIDAYGFYIFFAVIFAGIFLIFVDQITDQEVPAELPNCQEDEVLDYVVYDVDVDKRVYKCVHVDNL